MGSPGRLGRAWYELPSGKTQLAERKEGRRLQVGALGEGSAPPTQAPEQEGLGVLFELHSSAKLGTTGGR